MSQIEEGIKKVDDFLVGLEQDLKSPLQQVIVFAKSHRRILVLLALGYLGFKFFMEDEEQKA